MLNAANFTHIFDIRGSLKSMTLKVFLRRPRTKSKKSCNEYLIDKFYSSGARGTLVREDHYRSHNNVGRFIN